LPSAENAGLPFDPSDVSRIRFVPPAFMITTCWLKPPPSGTLLLKTIFFPSGEKSGRVSNNVLFVRRVSPEPSGFIE
jgi:hypothetical protein